MRKNRITNYIYPVLTALLIGVFEAVLFYFLDLKILVLPIAVVFDVIFTRIFVDKFFNYMSAFAYLLTAELISIGLAAAAYYDVPGPFLTYSIVLEINVLLHFISVFFTCTVEYLSDRGSKSMGYNKYFIGATIIMAIPVIAMFVIRYVLWNEVFPLEPAYNRFIPVVNYAAAVNAVLGGSLDHSRLLTYSLCYAGFFVPVGFYIHLIMGKRLFVLRLIIFLLLPACFECYQYFMNPAGFLAEDVILAFFGQLIGSVVYSVFNRICENVHGEEFLKKRDRMSFYR